MHKGDKKRSLILINRGSHARKLLMITQADLAEERLLALKATRAVKELHAKRYSIRIALESGAAIEPGIRTAEIVLRRSMVIR